MIEKEKTEMKKGQCSAQEERKGAHFYDEHKVGAEAWTEEGEGIFGMEEFLISRQEGPE